MRTVLVVALLSLTVAACGYKGPLYLPAPPAGQLDASAAK
ncbi:lipoprotein [Vogesella amnigena]|uniref:Lipoprotein n=1 Tax=Vogesella amnigena TaxID=1507449 RepID=A0ABV7TXF3_9NEIS